MCEGVSEVGIGGPTHTVYTRDINFIHTSNVSL